MTQEAKMTHLATIKLCIIAMWVALICRAAVGLHGYSGQSTPPLFGDYEAQRHWMEIALALPAREWYRSGPDNDLLYWGLDYPPISAYVSYVAGIFLRMTEPSAVALASSHGYESATSKAYMRTTVLVADATIFFPALLWYLLVTERDQNSHRTESHDRMVLSSEVSLPFILSLPALILIDHGHFQYNCISLGLFIASVTALVCGKHNLGASLFSVSVYFKQMNLYYAPAIAAYLLGELIRLGSALAMLKYVVGILGSVATITLFVFWPWLPNRLPDILSRLFPVSRGLYEDKVANVWCSLSVLVKINTKFDKSSLFALCAASTLLACVPLCIAVALRPSRRQLLLSSAGCAMAAYLLSYHVHEKQILIPLIPIALMTREDPLLSFWTSSAAAFSIYPLLEREGLSLPYFVLILFHIAFALTLFPFVFSARRTRIIGYVLGVIAIGLHCMKAWGPPVPSKPDLYTMLVTVFACVQFCLIYFILLRNTCFPPSPHSNKSTQTSISFN